jgi:hypothetical protein
MIATVSPNVSLEPLKVIMRRDGVDAAIVSGPPYLSLSYDQSWNTYLSVDDPVYLNDLVDGDYQVIFRDFRDDVGNFADTDGDHSNGCEVDPGVTISLW